MNARLPNGHFVGLDLIGQRFGRLVVLRTATKNKHGYRRWRCVCDCGNESFVRTADLRSGKTRSCGCLRHEESSRRLRGMRRYVHGHTSANGCSRAYKAYQDAKARCRNPNKKSFERYGGRGIRFLFTSFQQFLDEMGNPPPGYTLERCDNDGHYEPGNCRWATPVEQNNNKSSNRRVAAFGRIRTLARWAREHKIDRMVLTARLKRGWTAEDALTKPVRPVSRDRLTAFGRTQTIAEWANEVGVKYQALWRRLYAGWPIEDALTKPVRSWRRDVS